MSREHTLHLYTLHSTDEAHAMTVVSGETGYDALRREVARLYAQAEDIFERCYFTVQGLEGDRKKRKKQATKPLIQIQLRLNDALAPFALLSPDLKQAGNATSLIVYPTPARLVRATLRPLAPPGRESHFAVEIYAPHRHGAMRERYDDALERETRHAVENGRETERRFYNALSAPGRESGPDTERDIVFVARRGDDMIGYCECSLALYPYAKARDVRAQQAFFGAHEPGAVFDVAGLSALPSHGGYQIALVLLYHAFHFLQQHRALLPISHIVSHAASIVTKTYLTRQFGFAYQGQNAFMNDDFPDTLPPRWRARCCELMRLAAKHWRDALLRCDLATADLYFSQCLSLYQLQLWFRYVHSSGLELLLVLRVNLTQNKQHQFIDALIEKHLQLQAQPRHLTEWLRSAPLYLDGVGLLSPQTYTTNAPQVKVPAPFGVDTLVRLLVATRDAFCETPVAAELWLQLAQLERALDEEATLTQNYSVPAEQMRACADLLYPKSDASHPWRLHADRVEAHIDAYTEVFADLYQVGYMDAILPFVALDDAMQALATQYERGETKNFISASPQRAALPEEREYPDDELLLRVLLDKVGARIEHSPQDVADDDEYHANLLLRWRYRTGNLAAHYTRLSAQ